MEQTFIIEETKDGLQITVPKAKRGTRFSIVNYTSKNLTIVGQGKDKLILID